MTNYLIEPHGPWVRGHQGKDVVVAATDADALRQARRRVPAGSLYRYTYRPDGNHGLLYVAPFFAWEFK